MMHSKPTQLLCRHLINYCVNTRGVTGGVGSTAGEASEGPYRGVVPWDGRLFGPLSPGVALGIQV